MDNTTINTYALMDCDTTGLTFIDDEFAHQHNNPRQIMCAPRDLEVFEGRPIGSGPITHGATIVAK
jgi:hypothetical protein